MKIIKVCFALSQVAILLLTLSCSNSEDSGEEGNFIKETQDKIAQEATDMIKNPINAANEATEIANDRNSQFEEVKKQE